MAQHLQAEFIHVLSEQQQVVALIQHQLGGRQLGQALGGIAGGVVDVFLILRHLVHIFLQADQLVLLGAVEEQQVLQQVAVGAVALVAAEFQLAAEALEELVVLLTVVVLHGVQLVLDLLFQAVADQLELAVLLQHLTADVQAQVLAVHNALHEAEMVGQQVSALVHDQHAGGVQLQALFVVAAVVVEGSMAGDEEQSVIGGSALGAAHDHPGGIGEVVELILVELVVFLVGYLALAALPQGDHAVQGLQLGVGLVLGLVILTGIGGALLGAGLLPLHADGVAHIVAVLLYDVHQVVLVQELVVVLVLGVLLDHHDDLGTHVFLVGLGDGVALSTGALPLPGGVTAEGAADHSDPAGHHEGGVEAHAELTDDVDVLGLVVLFEVQAAAAGDGAQVLLQLLLGHTDAVIGQGQGAVCLIQLQQDLVILFLGGDAVVGQALEIKLVDGVAGVGDQFAQEDLLVGVDGMDHHIQQLFAFGLKFFYSHD